ncbi:MAG: serine hydrolase [Saprospiraceae bacterium]|nr:serine hydrolase [Saprospiraceae bacterium]
MTIQSIDDFKSKFNELVEIIKTNPELNVINLKASLADIHLSHDFGSIVAPHNTRSISKLILAYCYGIFLEKYNQGFISLDSEISTLNLSSQYLKEKLANVTIKHLLTNTIGYDRELLFSKDIKACGEHDLIQILLDEELKYPPGNHFVYSNASSYVLSIIFQDITGMNISVFANQFIFKKIGIDEFEWGNYGSYCKGGTGLYLNINNLHSIGTLLLNDGRFNSIQIVPKGWIKTMCKPHVHKLNKDYTNDPLGRKAYGFCLWIIDENVVFSNGNQGQFLIVNKEKKIVVSVMSDSRKPIEIATYLKKIVF